MRCENCDSELVYGGSFKTRNFQFIDGKIIHDTNIPDLNFCFFCNCSNRTLMIWRNNKIEMSQNFATPKSHWISIQMENQK